MDERSIVKTVIKNFDVLYRGEVISREYLMETYANFLNNTYQEEKHNVSIVLHTGSICFDIVAVVFAVVSAMVLNEEEAEDIVGSLEVGQHVLCKNTKYIFKGTEEKSYGNLPVMHYALLENEEKDKLIERIPKAKWSEIKPYYGKSKGLNGRGIRSGTKKQKQFLTSAIGIPEERVPGMIKTSVVLVMQRAKADDLIKNIQLFDTRTGTIYDLLELVTASYYTEGDEYYYSGNTAKADANIKITSKLSVARDLIIRPIENKVVGLFVLETDGVNQSKSELIELINRRSLNYVYVSYRINSELGEELVAEYEKANVFACTKEFLLQNSMPVVLGNTFTRELARQTDIIIDKEIIRKELKLGFSWDDYHFVRKTLRIIKSIDILDDNKEEFVIKAGALLNLMITAPCSMKELDEYLIQNEAGLTIFSVTERLSLINQLAEGFSYTLKEKAMDVISRLTALYKELEEESEKEKALKEILSPMRGESVAIVLPKAYYQKVLENVLRLYLGRCKVDFSTVNKFDNSKIYDRIIVLGDYNGKRFNIFKCEASDVINVLLYECEKRVFLYREQKARKSEKEYDLRSKTLTIDSEDEQWDEDGKDIYAAEMDLLDNELSDYIEMLNTESLRKYSASAICTGTTTINVVRVGSFAEGEKIQFSKYYKAIVYDEEKQEVKETSVEDLETGDVLVFANNNSATKGIVDEIFEKLVRESLINDTIKEAYRKSEYWKTVLREYRESNELTFEELGRRMMSYGSKKHFATIRSWIQPFSHIVGPKDVDSYKCIAQMTKDDELSADPESYCEACDIVRRERRKILNIIAAAIVKKLGGTVEDENDTVLKTVYDNIDEISIRRQLETITDPIEEYAAPISTVNRPINI